jgi:hypothetical protein
MSESLEFGAQLGMVVHLAVVNQNGIAILAVHGLLAGYEVDDREPYSTQRHVRGFVNALLVGPAMDQRRGGAADQIGLNRAVFMCESDNTAHAVSS